MNYIKNSALQVGQQAINMITDLDNRINNNPLSTSPVDGGFLYNTVPYTHLSCGETTGTCDGKIGKIKFRDVSIGTSDSVTDVF